MTRKEAENLFVFIMKGRSPEEAKDWIALLYNLGAIQLGGEYDCNVYDALGKIGFTGDEIRRFEDGCARTGLKIVR